VPAALRTVKAYYLAYYASMAMAGVYFPLYLKEARGMTERAIGLIAMIAPGMGMLMQPVWGLVADAARRRALVTALLCLASAALFPLVGFVTASGTIVALLFVHHTFQSSIIPLADSVAFEQLGPDRRSRFGNLRVYGTVGFLVALVAFGPLLEERGLEWLFPLYAASLVAAAACMLRIGPDPSRHLARHEGIAGLSLLYTNRAIMVLMLTTFLGLMAILAPMVFVSIYARRLGADNTQIGWLWTVGVIPEIVIMLYAGRIARRIGVKRFMALGLVCVAVRWIPFAFATSWWHLVPFQFMHGFAFGAVYVGAVTYVDIESPSRVKSSAQALLSMGTVQLGRLLGGPLCGETCARFGYRTLFIASGLAGLVACLVMLAALRDPRGETDD